MYVQYEYEVSPESISLKSIGPPGTPPTSAFSSQHQLLIYNNKVEDVLPKGKMVPQFILQPKFVYGLVDIGLR